MASIKLKDYGTKIKDIGHFNQNLRDNILSDLYNYDNLQDINYRALKAIYPINITVKNTNDSIEKHANKVLDYFKLKKNKNAFYLSFRKDSTGNVKQDSATIYFQNYFTQVGDVPKHVLEKLRKNIEEHMKLINDLIRDYESLSEVKSFLKEGKIMDNTIIHFYKRSLKKRDEILDHYLYTSYERAIEKCIPSHPVFKFFNFLEMQKDYPYLSIRGHLIDKHDFRRIDCFSHRYPAMNIHEFDEIRDLYKIDKQKFYQIIFNNSSTTSIFKNIFKNLETLPVHKTRIKIFKELKYLFQNKKWLSFYTLGLIQAEGLFTEMVDCSNEKTQSNGFVKKVNHIRTKYFLDQYDLDYFEFVLPDERNRLVHAGIDKRLDLNGYKLKSYDILTDLEYITQVFSEMENPLVYVTKVLKKQDHQNHFSTIEAFIEFFKNAEEIQKSHQEKFKETSKFVEDVLIEKYKMVELIKASLFELKSSIEDINILMNKDFTKIGSLEDIFKFNKEKCESLKKSKELKNIITEHFSIYSDTYEKFIKSFLLQNLFFKNYFELNKLPELTEEFIEFEKVKKKYNNLFSFINFFE